MKQITTGTEDFKELLDKGYYYVDKSALIKVVLKDKVSLFTRPRRFGKTLNMSMLYYFFSNKEKENDYLFAGLKVSKDSEIMKFQNKYPVIYLSLKDMTHLDMQKQLDKFAFIIKSIIDRNKEMLTSDKLSNADKDLLNSYQSRKASYSDLMESLLIISSCLNTYYQKKTIILIDEYDVPLQAAYHNCYYNEMVDFLRGLFSTALKTNENLEYAVLTGCLRIAKESIFTGLNNFSVYSIMDEKASDCFGFTQNDVDNLLDYYQLLHLKDTVASWYDGYIFGNTEIYNPWSVLKYINKQLSNKVDFEPESFWMNTSSNSIIENYIKHSDKDLREEFDKLIKGESIIKTIKSELTYKEIDDQSNIYSFLLFTGYLKVINKAKGLNNYELKIPNEEARIIYQLKFSEWFNNLILINKSPFYEALIEGNDIKAQSIMNKILSKSISYFDGLEDFYYGFTVGLLAGHGPKSNRESGDGRFDIAVIPDNPDETAIVLECKKVDTRKKLKAGAKDAVGQIIEKKYIEGIKEDGIENVYGYGISFFKKTCNIKRL